MLFEVLLPCLTIFGIGITVLSIIQKLTNISFFTQIEVFVFSIIIGSGIIIIPMAFFGLEQNKIFFQTWPLFLGFIGSIGLFTLFYSKFKIFIINLESISSSFQDKFYWKNKFSKDKHQIIIIILICFLCLDIIFYQLFLPIRGYDALWMYIPESLWYYQTDYIPIFDLMNFRPITKEPAHILLFSYSFYTTGNLSIQLLPALFLLGWAGIIYAFTLRLWQNQTKATFSVLLFLVSPFINWLVNFWAYYQDIFLGFFFSGAIYCVFVLCYFENTSGERIFYLCLGGLTTALTFLAKLSGWTLLVIIIIILPFEKKKRIIPSTVLVGTGIFLVLRATGNVHWGIGLAIVWLICLLLFILWRSNPAKSHNLGYGLLILPISILFGAFWLLKTLERYSNAKSSLIELYFSFENQLQTGPFLTNGPESPYYIIESAQSADFFAIILFLLIGNVFALFWFLPKLRSFFDKESRFFLLWILSFFIIWLTFYGMGSIRYLTPILVPMIIIVAHGVYKIIEDITGNSNNISSWIIIFLPILALFSYYFPISPDIFFGFQDNPNLIGV
ncbi:MAG: hypothetical protein ACXAC7_14665, partial [Candidatus Hodarchaeales archaeon]